MNSRRRSAIYEGFRPGQGSVYGQSSRSPSPRPLGTPSEGAVSDSQDSDSSGTDGVGDKRATAELSSSPSDGGNEDLFLMHSHRLSHAAEVGQLTRRQPGHSRRSVYSLYIPKAQITPPNGMVSLMPPTGYAIDTSQIQQQDSLETVELQPSRRKSISTFEFHQNVDLARELYQPQLAKQPRDEEVSEALPSASRPNSAHSKTSKKLVKKNRQSH